MRTAILLLCCLALGAGSLDAQTRTLTGRVTTFAGEPIAGARLEERGTPNTAVTDADGRYTLRYGSPGAVIRVSAEGYLSREMAAEADGTMDVVLGGVQLEGLVVVGTRRADRSATETPVAVDVIPLAEVAERSGHLNVNQLLQQVAPSFNANRQSGADGSDHIDPAALRGLGPDQTLVLINGKRRHQSSLINIFGSRGRGNTGTDLNAIPMAAIERIEILRDGASAQYGSDAIAGVINIVLKSSTDELTASVAAGARDARPPSEFDVLRTEDFDGQEVQAAANYGVGLGSGGGFLNLTGEYLTREKTNRPADPGVFDIYRRQFGDASTDNAAFFLNSRFPVGGGVAAYGFGGMSFRETDAYAWTRDPDSERNVPEIYPDGFDPRILTDITDGSLSLGLVGEWGGWTVDLNNTFGANRLEYTVDGTLNASMGASSPTRFDAGGFQFGQNTTGIGVSRLFPRVGAGLNLAFGAEYRVDRYEIFAGEEASWRNYGARDTLDDGTIVDKPGGSQGFPGFQPANELSETRSNLGAYADAELDVGDAFTVSAAARFENYSDFGGTLTGRLAARLQVAPGISLRGSAGTGFRAPSLQQIYFNTTFTDFVGGVAVDKLIARNDSELTRALGIPALREEKATNASVGVTARLGAFTGTVDAYVVDIDDRIVLTGAFEDTDPDIGDELRALDVGAAQFFTNALDTRTRGLDVVLAWARPFGEHSVRAALAANFNDMELGEITTSAQLAGKEDIYFGRREQAFLLASAPDSKATFSLDYGWRALETALRVNRWGEVRLVDWIDEEDVYEAAYTVDAALTWRAGRFASVTLGGTNIFDQYPSQQDTETETGGLWDAVQMGSSGAFWYLRLTVRR
ncbi:MAG TPA: TonB-dependent receptor [Longimicrobium sp.]|nr:TonB-dependent receptor [Longimicrobium sp.]